MEKEGHASAGKRMASLAARVMELAYSDILIHMRFFDVALARLQPVARTGLKGIATDGTACYYDPVYVLQCYRKEPGMVTRSCLHMLLHCVFFHNFQYGKLEGDNWDLASDIAVEGVVLELGLAGASLDKDRDAARVVQGLKEQAGGITAERLYRYFRQVPLPGEERERLGQLFFRDIHALWVPTEQLEVTQEQWKKISQRVKTDLKSFSRARDGLADLEKNLEEATRDRYDYGEILRRFTVMGEDMLVNDEEFDYVYYMYGLEHYGNLPLVEPLEYKESEKVREFVIAIDTSASCRGALVKAFLRRTYSILKGRENFFTKINVHIIQCDSQVQSDTKITGDEDFEKFVKYGKLKGFGATDFRPVFAYVEKLKDQGEFENLKGLIYFTDGYGIYPERMPDYQVIFAFLEEDVYRAPVPPWSMKVVLGEEELEKEGQEREEAGGEGQEKEGQEREETGGKELEKEGQERGEAGEERREKNDLGKRI